VNISKVNGRDYISGANPDPLVGQGLTLIVNETQVFTVIV
jgi:hypothetical protein